MHFVYFPIYRETKSLPFRRTLWELSPEKMYLAINGEKKLFFFHNRLTVMQYSTPTIFSVWSKNVQFAVEIVTCHFCFV